MSGEAFVFSGSSDKSKVYDCEASPLLHQPPTNYSNLSDMSSTSFHHNLRSSLTEEVQATSCCSSVITGPVKQEQELFLCLKCNFYVCKACVYSCHVQHDHKVDLVWVLHRRILPVSRGKLLEIFRSSVHSFYRYD